MDTLLHIALSNAVAAAALAVVAAVVGYFCRRPAVRHALWLLVLLKFVTPPLIDVPIPWPAEPSRATEAEAPAAPDENAVEVEAVPAADEAETPAVVELAGPVSEPAEDGAPDRRDEPAAAPAFEWRPLLPAAWLGGSLVWLALAAWRGGRFARLLRYARPAPTWLQREADGLAARLGLGRAPVVRLVPGRVSPMLWAPGWAARLLLPADLLGRLDAESRRTLLAHELAHLRRRDHRMRLFELLVTALFWWHPAVWWARRELREAEELCCDAWVLWALPGSAKTYALALVETVDFLSEAPAALPALASGIGHVNDLRRRVTMIMQGTTPRALTWRGLLTLLGLGAFLLPVMPTWAQQEAGELRLRFSPDVKYEVAQKAIGDAQDLQRLQAELEKKRAELAQLEAQLKAAKERLGKGAADGDKQKSQRIVLELVDGNSRQVIALPAGSRVIGGEGGEVRADVLKLQKKALDAKLQALQAETKKQPHGLVIEVISDGKRQVIELPPGSRVISGDDDAVLRYRAVRPGGSVQFVPKQPGQPALPPAGVPVVPPAKADVKGITFRLVDGKPVDADKRIADLEKKLDELTRMVRELRGELQKGKPALPMGPAAPRIPQRQPDPTSGPADPFQPTPQGR